VRLAAVAVAMMLCLTVRAEAPAKRPLPDYDGRRPAPATAVGVAVWVPRVILSPLYLTSEFLLRRPLSVIIPAAERADLPRKIYDFFTFGPEHKAGVAPVGFVQFGFRPSVGIYAFWDDAFVPGHAFRLHAETWPPDRLFGSLTERFQVGDRNSLELLVLGDRRPDHAFFGLGPRTLQSSQGRYGEDLVEGRALMAFRLWRASRIETGVGIRSADIRSGQYGGVPSIEQEAATGAFRVPYGFGRGYTAEYNRVHLVFDTRRPWPLSGSGVRLEAQAEQGNDVRGPPASGWVKYGATVAGFYDLNDHGRVVSLSLAALFADPLGAAAIPFTELVSLGGDGPMRGYWAGRLLDRSAAVATARYLWPIGPWLHGSIQAALGNVFGVHLDEFAPRLLRFSSAVGLSSSGSQDYPFEIVVGLGTETFEHGTQVDSLLLAIGINHAF
jgi:hypothetical protein